MHYIYTNILGTFVYDKELKEVEKVLFKEPNYDEFEKIGDLEQEKELMKKYPEHVYLNKNPDMKILSKLEFKQKNIRKFAINLAKQKIKKSIDTDILIIQAISNIEDLKVVANKLSKRLREWYELYNPEFSRSVEDHERFVELILEKDKEELLKDLEIETSMGIDLEEADLIPIKNLANEIIAIYKLIEKQEEYLQVAMKNIAPNLTAMAGSLIGAKLIALSGSLRRLSGFPASTIQLLGAEKALFRHIKNKKIKSPKHGVLISHPLVMKSKDKGKAARILADKISMAVKIDIFKGEFIGDKLLKDVENKLKKSK